MKKPGIPHANRHTEERKNGSRCFKLMNATQVCGQVNRLLRCPRVCQTWQAPPVKLARMFAMGMCCLTSGGRA